MLHSAAGSATAFYWNPILFYWSQWEWMYPMHLFGFTWFGVCVPDALELLFCQIANSGRSFAWMICAQFITSCPGAMFLWKGLDQCPGIATSAHTLYLSHGQIWPGRSEYCHFISWLEVDLVHDPSGVDQISTTLWWIQQLIDFPLSYEYGIPTT